MIIQEINVKILPKSDIFLCKNLTVISLSTAFLKITNLISSQFVIIIIIILAYFTNH